MAQYSLKVFYETEQLERFEHRTKAKLVSILSHPKYDRVGQTGPFGEEMKHPNRFEIFDTVREKLYQGNIKETLAFIGTLK